jgi:hypothetical protein
MHAWKAAGVALAATAFSFGANATDVSYDPTNVGGNTWQLSYDVTNNSLTVPISELTMYFNPSIFSDVAVGPTQPAGWKNPVAVQSDPSFLPDLSGYGFFDTIASTNGIAVGGSLGGFTVLVDYSGTGTPGSQIFQIVDPTTFTTLEQGQTKLSVPEPGTVGLLVLGLIGLTRRQRQKNPNRIAGNQILHPRTRR